MTIGIIGAGALGTHLARALAKGGVASQISNSRGPENLADLVAELGPHVTAVSTTEAGQADIVVLAVRWADAQHVLGGLPSWEGRVLVDGMNAVAFLEPGSPDANDPSNPLAAYGIKAVDLGGRHSSAIVRDLAPGARVVKAFNHMQVEWLLELRPAGGQRVLFHSGDDAGAKAEVRGLIERMDFAPVDLGPLDVGGPLASLPFGPLAAAGFAKL